MNLLYSPEQNKNNWDYCGDVGLIPKSSTPTDYDTMQDQNIEGNKEQIQETKTELHENESLDEAQQAQLDANDALDRQQQTEIDTNRENIIRVESELPTLDMEGTTLVIGKKGTV
jgi:hypothetical protein